MVKDPSIAVCGVAREFRHSQYTLAQAKGLAAVALGLCDAYISIRFVFKLSPRIVQSPCKRNELLIGCCKVHRHPHDEFLLLACDGALSSLPFRRRSRLSVLVFVCSLFRVSVGCVFRLQTLPRPEVWDVLSSQQAVDFVRAQLGDRSSSSPTVRSPATSDDLLEQLSRCLQVLASACKCLQVLASAYKCLQAGPHAWPADNFAARKFWGDCGGLRACNRHIGSISDLGLTAACRPTWHLLLASVPSLRLARPSTAQHGPAQVATT